jgi:hypothetical protein
MSRLACLVSLAKVAGVAPLARPHAGLSACPIKDTMGPMKALRILRALLGIPAGTLAVEAGVSVRELHRIEHRRVTPSAATLARLDDALARVLRRREQRGLDA